MFIDTHAHLTFDEYKEDLDRVVEKMLSFGVKKVINNGYDIESSKQAVELANKYDCMYAALGLHPYDAEEVSDDLMKEWENLIKENKKIVAIGETGLDYYKAEVSKEKQQESFRKHLELAKRTGLPVVVHNRKANEDCVRIIDEVFGDSLSVDIVFHCFGSDRDFATKLWNKGIFTSFTGIITFRNAEEMRDMILRVPDELFFLETDCPYLSPEGHRSKRNEPAFLVDIAHTIAEVKRISIEDVEKLTTNNALRFFKRMAKSE
ncbi:TatD family hydrolase [Patescibacteria group bacterium]